MSLYERKTDRVNKTRSRVARHSGKKGSRKAAGRHSGSKHSDDDFALHSALDTVQCVDSDDDKVDDSPGSVDSKRAEEQVAECEDEIDRVKRRHEQEMAALRAEVRAFDSSRGICIDGCTG